MRHTKKLIYAVIIYDLVAVALLAAMNGAPAPAAVEGAPAAEELATATPPETEAPVEDPPPAAEEAALPAGTPQPGLHETRALWVSRWDWQGRAGLQTIVERAAYARMNAILFQVRGQADALYQPGLEPWSAQLSGTLGRDPGWDPLAELLDLAHARGIEVHAWINVYPAWLGSGSPSAWATPKPMLREFNALYGNQWLLWEGGRPLQPGPSEYVWANPAHPAVVEHVVAVCKDLLTRYALDGLHFDYIRYADTGYSYDPVSNRAYAAATALSPGLTRADWQRAQVTGLVERVQREAMPLRPGAHLTTAAWPVYKDRWGYVGGHDGYNAYYQDSQGWAREGLVAGIMPMLYGSTAGDRLDRFTVLARDHVAGAQPGGVVVGIGADYRSFAEISARIAAARSAGAQGQALFSFGALEQHHYWTALRNGPYAEAAAPAWPS